MTQFLVNRVSVNPQQRTVDFQGEQVPAILDVLEVELVDESGQQSTIIKRFYKAAEKAQALTDYVPGQMVEVA